MDFKYLKIEDVRAGIKILKISRQGSLNALNREVINESTVFFETTMNDYSIRCIILTGEGDKAFVAG
ncbi:MAG: enoyl-CoA hydratase/isomerase family protein, partial [Deferribacterales bacterium]